MTIKPVKPGGVYAWALLGFLVIVFTLTALALLRVF